MIKGTIFDREYENDVFVPMFNKTMQELLALTFTDNNNRSTKKTNLLHYNCGKYLRDCLGNSYDQHYVFNYTENLRVPGNYDRSFDIDAIEKPLNEGKETLILVKAPVQSINKNTNNYLNTIIGEMHRIKPHYNSKYCLFMNLMPTECFYRFKNEHKVETVTKCSKFYEEVVKELPNATNCVSFLNIEYSYTIPLKEFGGFENYKNVIKSNDNIVRLISSEPFKKQTINWLKNNQHIPEYCELYNTVKK